MAKIAITKLKYVRLSKDETIEHMIEMLEVSRNQYEKWEEGTSTPPKIKKEFLGEYFNVNHKKLFTKFWVERDDIEKMEKRLTQPEIGVSDNDTVTVPFFKAERLKKGISQRQFSKDSGVPIYSLRDLENGYHKLSAISEEDAKGAISKYLKVSISKVCEPTEISSTLESEVVYKLRTKAAIKGREVLGQSGTSPAADSTAAPDIDEMSGQEVRDLAKRIYAQNLRYEEENEKLKATISEIQTANSEESGYKKKFEELQESTKGVTRVAELAKELFIELSLANV